MASLTIEVPDDLARSLEGLAAAQQKTVQQLAVDGLRSLIAEPAQPPPGSAGAVLRAMGEPPHVTDSDVAELEAAIAAGRVSVRNCDAFSN